jgi:citrate lyase beta subunit
VKPERAIRHFRQLDDDQRRRLFLIPPERLDLSTDRDLLATALGATLYMPADRADLSATVVRRANEGISSMVLDLEDAIDEAGAAMALDAVIAALDEIGSESVAEGAMIFVRVRDLTNIDRIVARITTGAEALSGFVIPKFAAATGARYLAATAAAGGALGRNLYCMPVLESDEIAYRETRAAELDAVAELLADHRELVLAVRIGATDLCGKFGIRRDRDHTIYDVKVIADAIADIVNRLSRCDGTGFVVSAPVWEYFADHERLFRTLLRATPFEEHDATRFRSKLVSSDLDGLLRETSLDRANGLQGKTVIHPSHVAAVHALSVVTHEEYGDATDVMVDAAGGVRKSEYRNKMNEPRPHRIWAQHVLRRARAFGVANHGVTFVDFLTSSVGR